MSGMAAKVASANKAQRKEGIADSQTIIRPFGNVENFQYHLIESRFVALVTVSARYIIPAHLYSPDPSSSTPWTEHRRERVKSHIEEAIAITIISNPALRIAVAKTEAKRPSWVNVGELDLANHVEWEELTTSSHRSYEDITNQHILKRADDVFPRDKIGTVPRWRVLCLLALGSMSPFVDVIFEYNHTLMDGTSGKLFHQNLLHFLNDNSSSLSHSPTTHYPLLVKNRHLTIPHTSPPLPPPLEKLVKLTLTPQFAISTAWKGLFQPQYLSNRSSTLARWAPIRGEYTSTLRIFDIDAATLKTVVGRCREKKTTLTGLFHGLFLVSLAVRLGSGGSVSDSRAFLCATPISMRPYIPQQNEPGSVLKDPGNIMGDLVSMTTHKFSVDVVKQIRKAFASPQPASPSPSPAELQPPSPAESPSLTPSLTPLIWQAASQIRSDITAYQSHATRDNIVGLMDLVSDWRAHFHHEAAKKMRALSWCVTNVGVFDGGLAPQQEKKKAPGEDNDNSNNGHHHNDDNTNGATEPRPESWTVNRLVFAVTPELTGAAFTLAAISVRDGALCVCVSWQDCVVDTELGDAVVRDLQRWLMIIGQGGNQEKEV
ncbi:alcohol acetyltransferase-domain-containing protein [Xylariaceae sp. FL0255]|nr:alcohol acetyltransferase-domain-containing protein [Xylariaceae sp. FL0255]